MRLGKIEKFVLVYLGVKCNGNLIKRRQITRDLRKYGNINRASFNVALNKALNRLTAEKNLVFRRYSKVGLTEEGKDMAKYLIDEAKKIGTPKNWNEMYENLKKVKGK